MNSNITVIGEDQDFWFVFLNDNKFRIVKSSNLINLSRGVIFQANFQLENSDQGGMQLMSIIDGKTTNGLRIVKNSSADNLRDDFIDGENIRSEINAQNNIDDTGAADDEDDDVYNFTRYVKKAELDLSRNIRSKYFKLLINNSNKFNEEEKDIFGSLSRRYRSHFLKEEFQTILLEIDPKIQLEQLNKLREQKTRFYGIPDVLGIVKDRIKAIEDFLGIKPKKNMKKMMAATKFDSIQPGGTMFYLGADRIVKGSGKVFTLENDEYNKIGFNQGDRVFWLYFEDVYEYDEKQENETDLNAPSCSDTALLITDTADNEIAREYFNAVRDYYNIIAFIKGNGIKPRHTVNEVKDIKEAAVICDGRKKLEGCSWIAYNEDTLWYLSYKLSAASFENNMKVNDQMVQCWRISMRHIKDKMPLLNHINEVMYKSELIPNE